MRTLPAACSAREGAADNFEGAIFGAVVDHDYAQIGIVGIERALDGALDNFFFVVGGNEHRDFRLVGSDLSGRAVNMRTNTIVDRKDADREQATGHENVAEKKDHA